MQEISMKTTAQIYDFSELQKKKRQRELREKRPFFITGAVLIISLLSVCFFLYFGDRVVKAQESANDIQLRMETACGLSLKRTWIIRMILDL